MESFHHHRRDVGAPPHGRSSMTSARSAYNAVPREDDEERLHRPASSGPPLHQQQPGQRHDSRVRRGPGWARLTTTAIAAFVLITLLVAFLPGPPGSHARRKRPAGTGVPPANHSETGDNHFVLLSSSTKEKLGAPSLSPIQRNDRTMSDVQCRKEFPLFYPQLDDLASWWARKGGIKKQTIDDLESHGSERWGYVRVVIRNGQIFIRSFKEGSETRNSALVQLLEEAMNSWPTATDSSASPKSSAPGNALPPIDLILSPGDRDCFPSEGGWMVTKESNNPAHKGSWLIPDFGFVGWPEAGAGSFQDFIQLSSRVEEQWPWHKKLNRLFWRGYANVYAVRQDMMHRTSAKEDPSRASWADVRETTFHNDVGDFVPVVSLHDHCQHKYLLHVEGNSYSGRGKFILSCHAVVITHPLLWTQHFHPALNNVSTSPDQNYIQLPGPFFGGVEETAKELQQADGVSGTGAPADRLHRGLLSNMMGMSYLGRNTPRGIADNAVRTLRNRYLTPAATMCYTRAALRHYGASLDAASWGPEGPYVLPGQGIAPGVSKNTPKGEELKGDIEVGVWRLLGSPDWPPARPKGTESPQ